MNIEMVDITKDKHFVVPEDGKYLVRRVSGIVGVSTDYFSCRVKRHHDTKKDVWSNRYDCNGVENITHVSLNPLP